MYAVIRAGGKQYRVAPGDVIEDRETVAGWRRDRAVRRGAGLQRCRGRTGQASKAFVTGEVVEQGRADKILVFHYKRKKQYKKLNGHRQPYTAVKITRHQCGRRRTSTA